MVRRILTLIIIAPVVFLSAYFGIHTSNSSDKTIEYAGLDRKYRIHYPSGFDKSKKYPLVISLHGFLHDARLMELYTGFSRKADQEGFIVVYPYAHKQKLLTAPSWNAGICCGFSFENNVDDIGYMQHLLDTLEGLGGVDSSRIYVVGISNGAMLGNLMALTMPDRIAAVAQVSGTVGARYEDDEEHTYLERSYLPIPVLIVHGRNDEVIRFDGGEGRYKIIDFSGAYDSLNFWLENNKCAKHPSEISNQEYITKEVYRDCEDSTVEFYAGNSKHTWPGSIDDFSNKISRRAINTTDIVWEFFSKQKK